MADLIALNDAGEHKDSRSLCGQSASDLISTVEDEKWYALYTRHQHEKAIARHLELLGFSVFLPLRREVHQWKDRRKIIDLPLFPCYVLFSGDIRRRFEILNIPGVCFVVGNEGKAAVIPSNEVNGMRQALGSHLPVETHPFPACGERARVHSGPLSGMEGIVMRYRGSLRLVLSIETLRRSISVEVDQQHVERAI